MQPTEPIPEYVIVRALRDFPAAGVLAGETGTIVQVYDDGGYEVEFVGDRTRPAVVTVEPADVEALVKT